MSTNLFRLVPFPLDAVPQLWQWLNEYPERSFDDFGPQSLEELAASIETRLARGEGLWGIEMNGELRGAIGLVAVTPKLAMFHGICLARRAWGVGLGQWAVSEILRDAWSNGFTKVAAGFFADNVHVHRFLAGLGAVEEGLLKENTWRNGQPVDMRLMAFFRVQKEED